MNHSEVMRILLEERARRALKREVSRLSLAEIVTELEERCFNASGEEEILRDRFLRVLMREVEPKNDLIPWYDWDFFNLDSEEQLSDVEQDNVVNGATSEAERLSEKQVTADVHQSATGSQMVPASTTTAVTTSQAGRGSVTTTVSTSGSQQTAMLTSSVPKGPEMTLPPEILNYLSKNPEQWEYQFAQLVRSTRTSRKQDLGGSDTRTPRRPVLQKKE